MAWHIVGEGGKTEGPYPEEQLAEWYKEGKIADATFAWRKGQDEWKRIGDIEDLFSSIQGVQGPPDLEQPEPEQEALASPAETAVAAALMDEAAPAADSASSKKKIGLKAPTAADIPADGAGVTCPVCNTERSAAVAQCPVCNGVKSAEERQKESNAFANLGAAGIIQKDLTKWGWGLMAFGILNFLATVFSESMFSSSALGDMLSNEAREGIALELLVIKIFSALQFLAGLITIIIYKRYMYVVIILMTLILAALNGMGGAYGLAGPSLLRHGSYQKVQHDQAEAGLGPPTMMTPDEILKLAHEKESQARDSYEALARECSVDFVSDLLLRLQNEETRHIRLIEEMQQRLASGKDLG